MDPERVTDAIMNASLACLIGQCVIICGLVAFVACCLEKQLERAEKNVLTAINRIAASPKSCKPDPREKRRAKNRARRQRRKERRAQHPTPP